MKRKLIALLMTLCIVLTFTGCKNKDDFDSKDQNAAVTEASKDAVTEKASEDNTEAETFAGSVSTDNGNSTVTEKEQSESPETSKPAEPLVVEDSLGIDLGEGEEGAW